MKKLSVLLVLAVMCLAMTGCFGSDKKEEATEPTTERVTAPETSSENDVMQDTSTNGANNTESDKNNYNDGSVTTTDGTSAGVIEEMVTDVSDGLENIGDDITGDPNENVNDVTSGR